MSQCFCSFRHLGKSFSAIFPQRSPSDKGFTNRQEVIRSRGRPWFLQLAISEITCVPDRYLPTLANAANQQLIRVGAIQQPDFLLAQMVDLESRMHEVSSCGILGDLREI